MLTQCSIIRFWLCVHYGTMSICLNTYTPDDRIGDWMKVSERMREGNERRQTVAELGPSSVYDSV